MAILQRGPKVFIDHMVAHPKLRAITQRPVNSQPFPMATISGSVTTEPTQEKMLRTKLFSAICRTVSVYEAVYNTCAPTPLLAFLGINSVNMVVTNAKISILPRPGGREENVSG